MLVNKSIDKAEEKFEILIDYINKNNYWDAIFYEKDKNDLLSLRTVFIPKKEVCRLMSINRKTLINWMSRHIRNIDNTYPLKLTNVHINNYRWPLPSRLSDKIKTHQQLAYREGMLQVNIRGLYFFLLSEVLTLLALFVNIDYSVIC